MKVVEKSEASQVVYFVCPYFERILYLGVSWWVLNKDEQHLQIWTQ
jgi:hypothetical protein